MSLELFWWAILSFILTGKQPIYLSQKDLVSDSIISKSIISLIWIQYIIYCIFIYLFIFIRARMFYWSSQNYNFTLVQRFPWTRHGKLNMCNDLAAWSRTMTFISYSKIYCIFQTFHCKKRIVLYDLKSKIIFIPWHNRTQMKIGSIHCNLTFF